VVSDGLDDALDFEGLEEGAEGIMAQVLEDIGLETAAQLASVPKTAAVQSGPRRQAAAATEEGNADLLRQLQALKS
jgi:division protein CdvB (Snf7/Vps24/ESCRT-III family)